jgi:hypothetical protein
MERSIFLKSVMVFLLMLIVNGSAYIIWELILNNHFTYARFHEVVIANLIICALICFFTYVSKKYGIYIFALIWLGLSILTIKSELVFMFNSVLFSYLTIIYSIALKGAGKVFLFNVFLVILGPIILVGYYKASEKLIKMLKK